MNTREAWIFFTRGMWIFSLPRLKNMEHKTFSNRGNRFETENMVSDTVQSEFDSLFETSNMVDRINREKRESIAI